MSALKLGAVDYLNARPLVQGLDGRADRFALRFDPPSRCAALLHAGEIDLGMIPSIEYLHGNDYRVVPGVSIASFGDVASVAVFAASPVEKIRRISLDSSSRTSVALLRVLCERHFQIAPEFVTRPPDLPSMLRDADAALLIGDPALFAGPEANGLTKLDLGAAWRELTGLPFVWAFWAGRANVLSRADVHALQAARDAGVASGDAIAEKYGEGDSARVARGRAYLRNNMKYGLGDAELAGLQRFYELAEGKNGVRPHFYEN
ncbi:MAG TPA: menaquinone biosynthesis protein [Vicinamibacterales bacterium]|jgi:chorismate dehydratase|nr:menaquinone biosynthesis protein [Vicinamibacterales bacterium]